MTSMTRLRVETTILKASTSIQRPGTHLCQILSLGIQTKLAIKMIAMNSREFTKMIQ